MGLYRERWKRMHWSWPCIRRVRSHQSLNCISKNGMISPAITDSLPKTWDLNVEFRNGCLKQKRVYPWWPTYIWPFIKQRNADKLLRNTNNLFQNRAKTLVTPSEQSLNGDNAEGWTFNWTKGQMLESKGALLNLNRSPHLIMLGGRW